MDRKSIINMSDIRKTYNTGALSVEVLKGISIDVKEGEFVTVVGASGSGKSTLMNIIGCLDSLTEGEYHLDGKNISSYTDNELSAVRNEKIGFIFQKFNLLPRLTALENVELPLIYRGMKKSERRQNAIDALTMVGLGDRMEHKPSEMSGGQQQRVAIARALAGNPPLLLADEPTGNLDSKSSDEVMDIILDLYKQGRTIVLITHDNEVARMGSRMIKVKDGIVIDEVIN
ncbi:ABC transporter ATP-binding protein [Peptostreptococcaceae bacterium AGR-M142]